MVGPPNIAAATTVCQHCCPSVQSNLHTKYNLLPVPCFLLWRLTSPHPSKEPRTWTDHLDKRPKQQNMDMRFGTWNLRSLYRSGSLMMVSRELARYKLDLVGVQEVRWEGGGTEPAGEYPFSGSAGGQMGGRWHRTCGRIHI
jgi:hypothetical protein